MPRLICSDISARYGGVLAVDALSLELEPAKIYGLIGPNGAGKSTLFKVITARMQPTQGRILLEGRDITKSTLRMRVRDGIVGTHQTPLLFADMTVTENIEIGALARGIHGRALAAETERVLGVFQLHAIASVQAKNLNLYQMRILEIARALSTAPKVLLLDESMAGIRDDEIPAILSAIRQVAKSGVTVVIVEHIIELIHEIASTVFLMDRGRLVASGYVEELRADPHFQEIYFGTSA